MCFSIFVWISCRSQYLTNFLVNRSRCKYPKIAMWLRWSMSCNTSTGSWSNVMRFSQYAFMSTKFQIYFCSIRSKFRIFDWPRHMFCTSLALKKKISNYCRFRSITISHYIAARTHISNSLFAQLWNPLKYLDPHFLITHIPIEVRSSHQTDIMKLVFERQAALVTC